VCSSSSEASMRTKGLQKIKIKKYVCWYATQV